MKIPFYIYKLTMIDYPYLGMHLVQKYYQFHIQSNSTLILLNVMSSYYPSYHRRNSPDVEDRTHRRRHSRYSDEEEQRGRHSRYSDEKEENRRQSRYADEEG